MAQKKKVTVKYTNKSPSSFTQSNNVKTYSFNPFQPKVQIIQTESGTITVKPKGNK